MIDDGRQASVSRIASPPGIGALIGGLIGDVKTLISQELNLAKHEVRGEIAKVQSAAFSLGLGIGMALVGIVLFSLMLVHFLEAITAWPLWICLGVVGTVCAGISGWILFQARATIADVHGIPQHTLQTVKEHAQWIKARVKL